MASDISENSQLKKTLSPLLIWGLGVGYVISGMYFGWNLGLAEGGTGGLAIATVFVIIMYLTFTFSYTELACAIPKAGGAFAYADRGLGKNLGFLAGMAQNIEFIFAPPAIAMAIGAYLGHWFPNASSISIGLPEFAQHMFGTEVWLISSTVWIAIIAYLIFTVINIIGVKFAAFLELIITIVAVIELLIFAGICYPEFEVANLKRNALPNGYMGAFAAIPFAIWFFLAIEGIANVAEEAKNPKRGITIGFTSAIATLVILCVITFTAAVGVDGWESVVYPNGSTQASDSPLPLALGKVLGEGHAMFHMLLVIGIFGLVASFHGIILVAGRSTFEFGRVGYIPKALGKVNPTTKTPVNALLINMAIGIIALFTEQTGAIITIAVFGALTLYIISMIAFFALRKKEPDLERPFRTPFYPWFPAIALIIATVAIVAMTFYNPIIALVYGGILVATYILFRILNPSKTN